MRRFHQSGRVMTRRDNARRDRAVGFTLVESVFAMVILSTMYIAVLGTIGGTKRSRYQLHESIRGQMLAETMLAEIIQRDYKDANEFFPSIGLEFDELSLTDRRGYDDVDDYHGHSKSPPELEDGSPRTGLPNWRRAVTVEWVDGTTPTAPMGYDTGLKRVTVSVYQGDRLVARRYMLRSTHANTD